MNLSQAIGQLTGTLFGQQHSTFGDCLASEHGFLRRVDDKLDVVLVVGVAPIAAGLTEGAFPAFGEGRFASAEVAERVHSNDYKLQTIISS